MVTKYGEDKRLINQVLISPEVTEWKPNDSGFTRREGKDQTNLFNPELLKVFPNVKRIRMRMDNFPDMIGQCRYTFSLRGLL